MRLCERKRVSACASAYVCVCVCVRTHAWNEHWPASAALSRRRCEKAGETRGQPPGGLALQAHMLTAVIGRQ